MGGWSERVMGQTGFFDVERRLEAIPGPAEAAGYRRDLGSMLRAVLTHELDRERIHPRRRCAE
jgi:hypothetical protein